MSAVENIAKEVSALYERGLKILEEAKKPILREPLRLLYEPWYTLAFGFVRQVVPERAKDFEMVYRNHGREKATVDNYTICDFFSGLTLTHYDRHVVDPFTVFTSSFVSQLGILKAAAESVVSLLRDVRTVLRAELFDNDLEAARDLVEKGHLRSAGVVSGVVLEGHLKSVAARRSITFTKRHLSLSELNDGLKAGGAYDVPVWRFIQRLTDIRNLCGHSGEREPTRVEVDDLIAGVDRVIKEVF